MSRSAVKAVSILWLSSLGGALIAFLTQVYLARALGPEEYGAFAAALVLVGLFLPVAGFGVAQFLLRVFGEEGWGGRRWLHGVGRLNFISSGAALALLVIVVLLVSKEPNFTAVALVLSLYLVGQMYVEIVGSKLQLEESYGVLALWQLTPHVGRILLLVVFASAAIQQTAIAAAIAYGIVGLCVAGYGVYVFRQACLRGIRLVGHGPLPDFSKDVHVPTATDVLRGAWPYGIATFFHLIYFQSGVVQAKFLVGDVQAGQFNVAMSVMTAIYLFPSVIYQRFLVAKLHRWAQHDRAQMFLVFKKGNWLMLSFGFSAAILLFLLADILIALLFGDKYSGAASLLKVLAFSVPWMFVAFSAGAMLVTQEHVKRKVLYMGGVAMLSAVLNYLFLSKYGIAVAAYVAVISNFFLMLAYLYGAFVFVFKGER